MINKSSNVLLRKTKALSALEQQYQMSARLEPKDPLSPVTIERVVDYMGRIYDRTVVLLLEQST